VRHVAAVVLSAACSLGGLTACTSSGAVDNVPRTTVSTGQPSSSSPSPSRSVSTKAPKSPAAPKMPPAARKLSSAGAKAFVRYYAVLVNSAWASGDTKELRAVGTTQCDACSAAVHAIERVVRAGGYKHGAAWHPHSLVVISGQRHVAPIVSVSVQVDRGMFRPAERARTRVIDPSMTLLDFHLLWRQGGWRVGAVTTS
jgi:Family of unknown function (DUF6318)